MPNPLSISPMILGDVPEVVDVHMKAFPAFFLTALGPAFLREYYSGILVDASGIAFVARDDSGRPAGFVAGASESQGFYRRLLARSWWRFGLAALPSVLRRPSIARRVLRGITYPGTQSAALGTSGLFSIGVSPTVRGRGLGRALVEAFASEAARRGADEVRLTTDATKNDAVNSFYLSIGFSVARSYSTPEGRVMNEYVRMVAPVQPTIDT